MASVAETERREGTVAGRPCPVCGCAFASLERGLSYRSCPACASLSTAEVPSAAELARYYNAEYEVSQAPLDAARRRRWSDSIGLVETHTAPGRALEIGASYGHLLRILEERGWRPAGVELSDRARAIHAERSPGIPTFADPEAARAAGWSGLDLVVALHTIEHVPAPEAFLGTARGLLREGGLLLLTTPNAGSLVRWAAGRHWQWRVAPAHLALFTPAGMAIALERAGFQTLGMSSRRGDASSTAAHLILSPARALKRRMPATAQAAVAQHSPAQGMAQRIDRVLDPFTTPLRRWAYQALMGPELVVVARRRAD